MTVQWFITVQKFIHGTKIYNIKDLFLLTVIIHVPHSPNWRPTYSSWRYWCMCPILRIRGQHIPLDYTDACAPYPELEATYFSWLYWCMWPIPRIRGKIFLLTILIHVPHTPNWKQHISLDYTDACAPFPEVEATYSSWLYGCMCPIPRIWRSLRSSDRRNHKFGASKHYTLLSVCAINFTRLSIQVDIRIVIREHQSW